MSNRTILPADAAPSQAPDEADPRAAAALAVAEAVRAACREAVAEAWEDAGVQGLCAEGRCEVAVGAVERLDLRRIVAEALEKLPSDPAPT